MDEAKAQQNVACSDFLLSLTESDWEGIEVQNWNVSPMYDRIVKIPDLYEAIRKAIPKYDDWPEPLDFALASLSKRLRMTAKPVPIDGLPETIDRVPAPPWSEADRGNDWESHEKELFEALRNMNDETRRSLTDEGDVLDLNLDPDAALWTKSDWQKAFRWAESQFSWGATADLHPFRSGLASCEVFAFRNSSSITPSVVVPLCWNDRRASIPPGDMETTRHLASLRLFHFVEAAEMQYRRSLGIVKALASDFSAFPDAGDAIRAFLDRPSEKSARTAYAFVCTNFVDPPSDKSAVRGRRRMDEDLNVSQAENAVWKLYQERRDRPRVYDAIREAPEVKALGITPEEIRRIIHRLKERNRPKKPPQRRRHN